MSRFGPSRLRLGSPNQPTAAQIAIARTSGAARSLARGLGPERFTVALWFNFAKRWHDDERHNPKPAALGQRERSLR